MSTPDDHEDLLIVPLALDETNFIFAICQHQAEIGWDPDAETFEHEDAVTAARLLLKLNAAIDVQKRGMSIPR